MAQRNLEVAYWRWVVLEEALDGGLLVLGCGEEVTVGIRSVTFVFIMHLDK